MNDFISHLRLEELPPSQREIAQVVGLDVYLMLVKYINGDSVYFPKYDSLKDIKRRTQRDEEIIGKFDGYNFKPLAEEYNLTVKSIYNIIPHSIRNKKRNVQIAGQISIEDMI